MKKIMCCLFQVPAQQQSSASESDQDGEVGITEAAAKTKKNRKSSMDDKEQVAKDLRRDTREIPLSSPNISSGTSEDDSCSEETDSFGPLGDQSRFLQMSTPTKVWPLYKYHNMFF